MNNELVTLESLSQQLDGIQKLLKDELAQERYERRRADNAAEALKYDKDGFAQAAIDLSQSYTKNIEAMVRLLQGADLGCAPPLLGPVHLFRHNKTLGLYESLALVKNCTNDRYHETLVLYRRRGEPHVLFAREVKEFASKFSPFTPENGNGSND